MTYSQISKKAIHPKSINLCSILKNAGYQAYLVGGCVRDLFLGVTPKDWDITTDALPQQVIALFPKTYPTGIQHGTITVALEDEYFEVTTFRTEGKYTDNRRPDEVKFVSSVEEDLSRRDLTINSMAYDPITDTIIDPFNGLQDLQNGIIKAVGNADDRFQEDGLRILRTIRFACRFNYEIEEKTRLSMQNNRSILNNISKERIKDEFCKIMSYDNSFYGLRLLLMNTLLPLVSPLHENYVSYTQFHQLDADLETKIADFYYEYNPIDVEKELRWLKFSNDEIKRIIFFLKLIPMYRMLLKISNTQTYIRFIAHIKNNAPQEYTYTLEQFLKLVRSEKNEISKYLFEECADVTILSRKEMKINGNDLINIGIPIGPEIKKALDKCYQEILNHPENNNKDILLKFVLSDRLLYLML